MDVTLSNKRNRSIFVTAPLIDPFFDEVIVAWKSAGSIFLSSKDPQPSRVVFNNLPYSLTRFFFCRFLSIFFCCLPLTGSVGSTVGHGVARVVGLSEDSSCIRCLHRRLGGVVLSPGIGFYHMYMFVSSVVIATKLVFYPLSSVFFYFLFFFFFPLLSIPTVGVVIARGQ